ncbi:MAG: DNA topoisomerase IV subunit B [Actinobacteria bacterium]|uniref:DNA topoisomerase (ATP-hydrolyzing) n=1 Tax=freshwater metagenome TaxID=449393 RepID=A0A6J6T5W4_9ZZZZ|nr:DNA topoisomerase IV subunit B [Actinomycetota bacterium]
MAQPTSSSARNRTPAAYDAKSIQLLKGLEAVRKRPGMYIGGTGPEGLHHLVWELIDNSVDEAAAGFANLIEVTLHRDSSVEVSDNGRGIPIGKKDGKRTALEVVFTELHAGGKFGTGAYSSSGGLHGVGASVVNALAAKLIVEVDLDGATHRLSFENQLPGKFSATGKFTPGSTLEVVRKIPPRRTGTRVRFWPDLDIFDPGLSLEYEIIRDHCAQVCFLVPGLKVRLIDKRGSSPREPEEFVAKGGLADLVETLSLGESITEVITLHGQGTFEEKVPVDGIMQVVERTCTVDIAIRWVKGFEPVLCSFVNTIPTVEGGTHVAGFERAMTKVSNDVLLAGTKKLARFAKVGKDRAEKGDVQEGMVAAIKVTFPEPQFKGQTKQELGTPAIQSIVYEVVRDNFTNWIEGGGKKTHIAALRDKITQAVINRVTTKATLDARRKAANLNSGAMPDKLADCRRHGIDAELLIVEGDSAAGPAKAGRNAEYMAVLPLRGKVVNAGKSTLKQVIENAEAQALFTAVGAGSGADFNLDQARYGRIIILCDADVDGSHIRCLLLTLIYHYMRPLLEAGRVFAAQPPLYTVKVGDKVVHAFSDADKDRLTAELSSGNRKAENLQWVRFKGLGEMDVEELAVTCLDAETRILRRITMQDAEALIQAGDLFETLMGTDVARRRQFLLDHSELVDRDILDV